MPHDMSDHERLISINKPPSAWTASSTDVLLADFTHKSPRIAPLAAPTTYDWRPKVMQAPYLIFVAVLSFILSITQECLCQRSMKHGSLFTFERLSDVSPAQYILWRYVPPVSSISYGLIVATLDLEVMRFSPYHKLNQPKGLRGVDYIIRQPASHFWYLIHPSKAGSLVWVSALGMVVASVLVPLSQTASLASKHEDGQKYTVSVNTGWSRFLSIVLLVNVGCVAALWKILRKPTHLKERPYSIAGIISTFGRDCFEDLTQNLSVLSDQGLVKEFFKHEQFVLQNGVVKRFPRSDKPKYTWESVGKGLKPLTCKPGTTGSDLIAMVGLGFPPLFAVTAFARVNTPFQIVPWIGPGFAVIYKLIWAQFEIYLRGIDPFSRLRRGNASPRCLFDDYTGSPILLMAIRAFKRGSRLLAFQGCCSVMLEVWVIAVTSFCDRSILLTKAGEDDLPNYVSSGRMLSADFYIAAMLGTIIPAIASISAIIVNFRARKSDLPAKTSTIINLLLYTQGTRLRASLEQMRDLDPSSRERRLCQRGKKYALGWSHNSTFGMSVYIEEEPRLARYRHIWTDEYQTCFFRDYRPFGRHFNDQMQLSDFRLYARGARKIEPEWNLIGVTGIEDWMKGQLL